MKNLKRITDRSLLITPLPGHVQFYVDVVHVFRSRRMQWTNVLFDLQSRYRRTLLGPLWITMSVVVFSIGYTLLVGVLFQADLKTLTPYIISGALIWQFFNGLLCEAPNLVTKLSTKVTNGNSNYVEFGFQATLRHLINFFHGIPVILLFLLFLGPKIAGWPLFLVNIVPIFLVLFFAAIPISLIAVRFRDIAQATQSLMQFMFYMTPILWRPDMLPEKYIWFALINPFYHMLELLRAPLIGGVPTIMNYLVVLGLLLAAFLFSVISYIFLHKRTSIWL